MKSYGNASLVLFVTIFFLVLNVLSELLFFLVSRYLHSQLCTDSGLCYCLLQMDNHHPCFPTLFTTIWDTTCIRVEDSGDWALGRYTNNGHYDFPCYLVLLGITFTGLLVFYSGLHRSTAYDSHIFNDTAHLHPQHPCEMNIGDGDFKNSRNFATPPTKPQGGHFSNADFIFMQYLQLARSRIETLNTVFKCHGMFQSVFRGHVVNLSVFVKIAVHGTAVELRARSRAGRCTRHEGYGWWSHF